MFDLVAQLKERLRAVSDGAEFYEGDYELDEHGFRKLPIWVLQPYRRVDGTLRTKAAPHEDADVKEMEQGKLSCAENGSNKIEDAAREGKTLKRAPSVSSEVDSANVLAKKGGSNWNQWQSMRL